MRWYRKAAEQGFAQAQLALGNMYMKGRGVAQDYKEAAKWYRQAAEQRFAAAQCSLGRMYENGWGVPGIIQKQSNGIEKPLNRGTTRQNKLWPGLWKHTKTACP